MDIQVKSQPFTKRRLRKIKRDLESGRLRRFGAIVSHYKLGFTQNAMVAWVKNDVSAALAKKLKAKDYISHIYLRKSSRNWPYRLYTMLHARTKAELNGFIKELEALMPGRARKVLKTVKEFKKTSFSHGQE